MGCDVGDENRCDKLPLLVLSQAASSDEFECAEQKSSPEISFFEQSMEQLEPLSGEQLRCQCFGKAYASLSSGFKRAFSIRFSESRARLVASGSPTDAIGGKAEARLSPTEMYSEEEMCEHHCAFLHIVAEEVRAKGATSALFEVIESTGYQLLVPCEKCFGETWCVTNEAEKKLHHFGRLLGVAIRTGIAIDLQVSLVASSSYGTHQRRIAHI